MKRYFKIGEISKLYQIGSDSLRYYEELGILCPKRGENGYRQYSLDDLWRLNVIRDLRKLDFPLERIKDYLNHRSVKTTEQLLTEEYELIREKITELESLKANVANRLQTIRSAKQEVSDSVTVKHFPDRPCYMIHSGYEIDEEMDMLMKQLLNRDMESLYIIGNNRIGSMISMESVKDKKYRDYSSVFIITPNGDTLIPGGSYLSISYSGASSQNADYIPKLLAFAKKQNLKLTGSVLELLWVDIHQSKDVKEHITELQIAFVPQE